LDAGMFAGPLDLAVDSPSTRVAAGLGVIPRIVRDGAEIYARKLDPIEAQTRLRLLHQPYHAALADLVAQTITQFGIAIVVDCHSMPSALSVPDMVLGDRHGASAPAWLSAHAQSAFAHAGFSLTRNTPYAGGYTTMLYGSATGTYALQIEINRKLYLDEESITRRANFQNVKTRLTQALSKLVAIDLTQLRPNAQAAE